MDDKYFIRAPTRAAGFFNLDGDGQPYQDPSGRFVVWESMETKMQPEYTVQELTVSPLTEPPKPDWNKAESLGFPDNEERDQAFLSEVDRTEWTFKLPTNIHRPYTPREGQWMAPSTNQTSDILFCVKSLKAILIENQVRNVLQLCDLRDLSNPNHGGVEELHLDSSSRNNNTALRNCRGYSPAIEVIIWYGQYDGLHESRENPIPRCMLVLQILATHQMFLIDYYNPRFTPADMDRETGRPGYNVLTTHEKKTYDRYQDFVVDTRFDLARHEWDEIYLRLGPRMDGQARLDIAGAIHSATKALCVLEKFRGLLPAQKDELTETIERVLSTPVGPISRNTVDGLYEFAPEVIS